MLEAAKAAVMSVLCPSTRRALGYAPQSFQSPDESDHDRSFVHRRLHLPLNAAAKSLLLFRPITLLLALVIALVGGLASAFFSLTRISPPALECPTDGPRTRPRPRLNAQRKLSVPPVVDEPRGWLGFARRKRAPLSSPPHTLRLTTMTPHDLANVTESDEEEEDDMESMTADHESESDGPSEVDTVEDAATSPAAAQKGKATASGFFRRRPKRGVSDSSSEVALDDAGPAVKGLSSLSAKACANRRKSRRADTSPPPSPSSSSFFPTTSTSTSSTSTTASSRKPSPSRPPIRTSHSTPHLSSEPDSYLLPPRASGTPAPISRTNSFPTQITQPGRRRFTFKNTFRSRSPLSSPPASPQLSPTIPPKSLTAVAVDLDEESRGEREDSPGSPDTSGRSGLTLGDIAPARKAR